MIRLECLIRISVCGLCLFTTQLLPIATPLSAQEQMNVVLLLADDLGWTGLECFGSDFYETPNLNGLAKQGVKFTDAYSACTVCSPTRASIMTGMYPGRLRLTDFIAGQNRPFARMKIPDWTKGLSGKYFTIAEALKESGYKTGHVGKWHLSARNGANAKGMSPREQGFDFSFERPKGTKGYLLKSGNKSETGSKYLTDLLTDKACEFIEQSKASPFFLYFAYNVPHTPIQGREDYVKKFKAKLKPNLLHNNPIYAAMVKSLDDSVGRILDTLDELELSKNTVVIFVSDNGGLTQRYGKPDGFTENLPLRRGKGSAYEGGVRVPMITRWPGEAPGACNTPVMTIDLYPTVLKIAKTQGDAAHNSKVDGLNIIPLMKNQKLKSKRDLYWHYPHYHAGGDGPYSAIRSENFRLIEFHEDKSLRLYDLATDPGEQYDLAKLKPDQAATLLSKLQGWRESVGAQMPTINPNFDASRQFEVRKAKK